MKTLATPILVVSMGRLPTTHAVCVEVDLQQMLVVAHVHFKTILRFMAPLRFECSYDATRMMPTCVTRVIYSQAKDFDEQENVKLVQEGFKVRGEGVVFNGTFIDRGYVTYENLNFEASGTTKSILLRYSTFNDKGGKMQFRTGGVNGTIVADYADYNSPADSFRTASVMLLEDVSGMQDLTIVAMEDKRFGFDIAFFELSDIVN